MWRGQGVCREGPPGYRVRSQGGWEGWGVRGYRGHQGGVGAEPGKCKVTS